MARWAAAGVGNRAVPNPLELPGPPGPPPLPPGWLAISTRSTARKPSAPPSRWAFSSRQSVSGARFPTKTCRPPTSPYPPLPRAPRFPPLPPFPLASSPGAKSPFPPPVASRSSRTKMGLPMISVCPASSMACMASAWLYNVTSPHPFDRPLASSTNTWACLTRKPRLAKWSLRSCHLTCHERFPTYSRDPWAAPPRAKSSLSARTMMSRPLSSV
mmetsp:Transcript_13433/g.31784  ORF Transcript_13433/g.31784 Transcript_13433/m.31784 type:complete len:215 (+) Transcript_13433:320-964(+)